VARRAFNPQFSAKLNDISPKLDAIISAKLDAIFGRFDVELRRAA